MQLLSSPVFSYLLIGLSIAYILFSYAMGIFVRRPVTKALSYLAIVAYLILFFGLALVGVRMDVLLCVLMALYFVYVLLFYVKHRLVKKCTDSSACKREGSV